jgi:hypothetical protein
VVASTFSSFLCDIGFRQNGAHILYAVVQPLHHSAVAHQTIFANALAG